ncbi:heterokaryon incompatibility protein-domain-containing protein [Xylaria digitata]|nr:heterokaryon incompatibility protein-domain-containing protein [Xylaria digitata]
MGLYKDLPGSTIRLLDIHPGEGTEPLTLSLSPVSLDSLPAYEAISYHWGPVTDVVPVILFGALSQFRLADRQRTLWADAICINQTHLAEKDEARVLLHLPEWVQETRALLPPPLAAFDAPNAMLQFQKLLADALQRRREGKSNLYDHDWKPLVTLVAWPWFRRKWIVQEVVLAREAVLCIGHARLSWTELALLAYTMSTFELVTVAGRQQPMDAYWVFAMPMNNITFILEISQYRQHATLMDGIMATNHFLCTVEHDHIYALLGLQFKNISIKADYEIPAAESFVRFAKGILLEGRSLKVLGLAPYKSLLRVPDTERLPLPSWVPDLRYNQHIATLVSFSVLKQRFHAGGRGKPIISLSENGLVLHARGRIIDTVTALPLTWVDVLQPDHPEARSNIDILELGTKGHVNAPPNKWLLDCYNLAVRNITRPEAELMSAFAHTMVCNMNSREGLAEPGILNSFSEYLASLPGNVATPDKERAPNPHFMPICTAVTQAAGGRAFCITEQQCDRICILTGGETPYMIRPTEYGRYRLIGEAYVDGVMDGEALGDAKYQDEEIQIE